MTSLAVVWPGQGARRGSYRGCDDWQWALPEYSACGRSNAVTMPSIDGSLLVSFCACIATVFSVVCANSTSIRRLRWTAAASCVYCRLSTQPLPTPNSPRFTAALSSRPSSITYKTAVLSQRSPRDAPTKVNKQPHVTPPPNTST